MRDECRGGRVKICNPTHYCPSGGECLWSSSSIVYWRVCVYDMHSFSSKNGGGGGRGGITVCSGGLL